MARLEDEQELPGLDGLFADAVRARLEEQLVELRDALKRLPMVGPYNASLINIQRPGARYVASAGIWRERFGRRLRPSARPLIILWPFGPVALVYDVSDTYGDPMPADILAPFRASGPVTEAGYQTLTGLLAGQHILHEETRDGSQSAGSTRTLLDGPYRPGQARAPFEYGIVVNSGLDPAAKLVTLFHELAHIFCQHLPLPGKPHRKDGIPSLRSREFEAEVVAWLLCARLDIDSPSGEYLHGYLEEDGTTPKISQDIVASATGKIETLAGGLERLARIVVGAENRVRLSGGHRVHEAQAVQGVLDLGL